MIRDHVGQDGNLTNDAFSCAALAYRNTADKYIEKSPAQILFGRQLREFVPTMMSKYRVSDEWRISREERNCT